MNKEMDILRVACVQMNSGDSPEKNLQTAAHLLDCAAKGGAKLAVLPEFFPLLSADENLKLTIAEEDGKGMIQDFLRATAQTLGLFIIGGTIPLRAASGRVYSASQIYSDKGDRLARYDKIHLFRFAGKQGFIDEAQTLIAGQTPMTAKTPWGIIGLSVCYDLRFPELYRNMQADIISAPSAFTVETGKAHWEILLRCRAVENLAHVIAPAQCGKHPGGRTTYGHSMIVDPWGNILAEADGDEETVLFSDIDAAARNAWRERLPALKHRKLP